MKNVSKRRSNRFRWAGRLQLLGVQLGIRLGSTLAPQAALSWVEQRFITPPRFQHPAIELKWLQQARQHRWVTRDMPAPEWNGLSVVAHSWGPEQAPRVVLLHGWGGRGTQLQGFIQPLLDAGFQVAALDAPAHGLSAGRHSSLLHFAAALQQLEQELGRIEAVLAHSLGGAATLLALSRGLQLRRAVLVAPPADLVRYSKVFARLLGLKESLRLRLQQRFEHRVGVRWDDLNSIKLAGQQQIPGLIIHDRDDTDTYWQQSARIAAEWPGAALHITEGLGHRRILKDAAVIQRSVDFLKPVLAG